MSDSSDLNRPRINLAIQGGGSHGAFTWGVIDRLLEDDGYLFEGISGTSAGAMNALVLATGLARGGRVGAREALERFWMAVGEHSFINPIRRSPWDIVRGKWASDSWAYQTFMSFTHTVSPYQWNPLGFNPLKRLVREHIDFDLVRKQDDLKIFVSATCIETGRIRVFKNEEIEEKTLLASSALPFLFHAVQIGDRHYWDGGFCGNPALFPLFYECKTPDVMLVQINPLFREKIPVTTFEIQDRVSEISFNQSLAHEMRAIQFVTRLIEKGQLDSNRYRKVLFHLIESEKEMAELGPSTKVLTEKKFLLHLKELGREAATRWLKEHGSQVGKESTIDIKEKYLTHD